jgi:hypothetical protein
MTILQFMEWLGGSAVGERDERSRVGVSGG